MNILLVKLSAIGDVVHTLPALGALRSLYGNAHITWVVEEAAADLLESHPWLDRVIISRRKSWLKRLAAGDIKAVLSEFRAFLGRLRDRNYDLVIDFHGLFKSALIVWLSSGKRKVGFDSLQELSGLFYGEKVFEDLGKHAVDRYLDIVRHLGEEIAPPTFPIFWGAENEKKVVELLALAEIADGEPFVALNPVALWPTKLWPAANFARLSDLIAGKLGLKVLMTGAEHETLREIKSLTTAPLLDLTGKTTLKDLACLYRKAALVISTDSGPMHIACAVGTRVIALFGPTDPIRTGPYGTGHQVLRLSLDCSPCLKKKCRDPQCMTGLTAESVFSVVEEHFTKKTPPLLL